MHIINIIVTLQISLILDVAATALEMAVIPSGEAAITLEVAGG